MATDFDKRLRRLGYPNYAKFLASVEWKETRARFFHSPYVTRVGGVLVCDKCGALETSLSKPLHVHHKTYENLGYEKMTDLQLVCYGCHASIHHRTPEPIPPPKRAYLVINTLKPAPIHLSPEPAPAKFKRVNYKYLSALSRSSRGTRKNSKKSGPSKMYPLRGYKL